MRRFIPGIALALTAAASATVAPAQSPRVGVDRRVEFFAIVFKLAGASEFNQNRFQPYIADIERHFGPFRSHPAIALTRALRDSMRIYFSEVPELALHVTDPPELRERVPFDRTAAEARWRSSGGSRLLAELRRFAVDARAGDFFAAHQPLYDSAGARMRRIVEQHADLGWFAPFFGAPPAEDFVIVPLLANSGTNFGPSVRLPGECTQLYAIVGHVGTDSSGLPVYTEGVVSTLVHEFNHSYVNRVVDAHVAELERSALRVHALVADAMREQAYSWRGLLYESLVNAAVARYHRARQGDEAERAFLAEERAGSWLWLGELSSLLGAYEADRARYPTLASFMPRVVAYFDSLPERVPEMLRRYDATRPKVLSLSIENGSQVVDPALTEIVVRFDRPVRAGSGGVTRVPDARERFPKVTRQELDSAGTTLRLSVELEPGRDYELRLNTASGNGFRSVADGVPLAPYRIRFRTRPAP